MGTVIGILIFVGFTIGIWISYRLFTRGDTAEEKVAALLPADFKPDLFHRKGDTYVGYEKEQNRLVLVDWPAIPDVLGTLARFILSRLSNSAASHPITEQVHDAASVAR